MLIIKRVHAEIPEKNIIAKAYVTTYTHFPEPKIVLRDLNTNKGWTTVTTPRSIEQRNMMEKEDSFERSLADFQKINRTKELRIVPATAKAIFTTLAAIALLM